MVQLFTFVLMVLTLSGSGERVRTAFSPLPVNSSPTITVGPTAGYSLPPDKLAKAYALYEIRGWLLVLSTLYSFAILIAFIRFRWTAKLRDWSERVSTRRFVQAMMVVPLFAISFTLLRLPLGSMDITSA